MPLSRQRKTPKRKIRKPFRRSIPEHLDKDARFEAILDRALYGTGIKGPQLVYHYTSWDAAENIVRSQRFWATSHQCTNDPAELTSADQAIMELARNAANQASGIARDALIEFLEQYEAERIGRNRRLFLICFSLSGDDPNQWRDYGHGGAGVCLGIRLLRTPAPRVPELATAILPVGYGEDSLRATVGAWLAVFKEVMSIAVNNEHNRAVAVRALHQLASGWAIATKKLDWSLEQEVRMVFLEREGASVTPLSRMRADGSELVYLPVPVTALSRMPIEELIVGPSQDIETARRRAIALLSDLNYTRPASRVLTSRLFPGTAQTNGQIT